MKVPLKELLKYYNVYLYSWKCILKVNGWFIFYSSKTKKAAKMSLWRRKKKKKKSVIGQYLWEIFPIGVRKILGDTHTIIAIKSFTISRMWRGQFYIMTFQCLRNQISDYVQSSQFNLITQRMMKIVHSFWSSSWMN